MKKDRRFIASICWIVIGAALMGVSYAGLADEYWSGMGTALFAVGVIQIVRWIRYWTNGAYKAQVDVEAHDERNRFISGRAWAWAGYLYVLLGAAASVVFRIAGYNEVSVAAGMSVCILMVLYWISWLVLRRKY
ncbi:MAG: hypothetical protein ACI4MM_02445 [Candidatus Ventricola sp.]